MAGTVNHATNNEMMKNTDSVYLTHGTAMEKEERLRRREQYHARRNRETAEENNQSWKQEEHIKDVSMP